MLNQLNATSLRLWSVSSRRWWGEEITGRDTHRGQVFTQNMGFRNLHVSILRRWLTEMGAHPYISETDQARHLRQHFLTSSHIILLRLPAALFNVTGDA
jgi:hypothetical protein